jgi:hypothetical protein
VKLVVKLVVKSATELQHAFAAFARQKAPGEASGKASSKASSKEHLGVCVLARAVLARRKASGEAA